MAGLAPREANLALGRPYTLTPTPSYPHCTDPDDLRQLTDGRSAGSDWVKKSTVGWRFPKPQPIVVIDLGQPQAIEEVRVHSVGGGRAGVFCPAAVFVAVSDDNQTFHVVGATHGTGLPQQRFDYARAPRMPYVLRIGGLSTRARFVLLLFESDGDFVFADEVEILRGEHDPRQVSFAPDNRFQRGDIENLLPALHEHAGLFEVQRWFASTPLTTDDPLRADWDKLSRAAAAPRASYDAREIGRLTDELYTLRGRYLQRGRSSRLGWSVANPMEQLQPTATLPDEGRRETLALRCWQGEYESAAVTLVNQGLSTLHLKAVGSALRSGNGTTYPAEQSITLRQAINVHSRSLGPIGDALVRLRNNTLQLPAGGAGQLWLTFHNPSLPPGDYDFELRVTEVNEARLSAADGEVVIPAHLTVDPIAFPDRPTLKTYNWAYIHNAAATARAPREALADLKAHYINVFVLPPNELPLPRRDRSGRIHIDFNAHVAALRLYEDATQYLFFWGLGSQHQDLTGLPPRLSPEWKRLLQSWLREWVAVLKEQGIGYDRFAMYPYDEYIGERFYELARFIKEEVDPHVRLFANARGDKSGEQMRRIAPYVDIWCFNDREPGYRYSARERELRSRLSPWSYACLGPSKALPPYSYYRLQMWRAFERGDTGCGFWTYANLKADLGPTWDDLPVKSGPYDVVYGSRDASVDTAGENVVPSRRWEAWREGVEDYEYLAQLKAAINAARENARHAAARAGQAVLDKSIQAVLSQPADPETVYRVRRDITEAILRLSEDR